MLCACSPRSALHFGLGVEQACSAAARVLLASPSRTPPSSCSSCLAFLLYEAFPHAEVRRLRVHVSCGSALPSSASTSSFLWLPICVRYVYGGGRMCFPVREFRCLPGSHTISSRFCPVVPRSRFAPGRPDVFPGRDCVHLRVHCCIALFDRFLFVHIVRACCGQALRLGLVGARALACAVL